MTDDTDLRTAVARALHKVDMGYEGYGEEEIDLLGLYNPWDIVRHSYLPSADAAIAAAEPLIRRKVIAELVEVAQDEGVDFGCYVDGEGWVPVGPLVIDWLRDQEGDHE